MKSDDATKVVFKICLDSEWQEAVNKGVYTGSALDLRDGFIHLSTSDQVIETAQLHFRNITSLVLVAVDRAGLDIRYEESALKMYIKILLLQAPHQGSTTSQFLGEEWSDL